ncbi:Bifunctional protein GlmU [Trichinella spiralis]|uniref:Bifunctional protein GlmU n=1 Tax=Trichinella spiralis TaxID=6334 RepID=A0ABR3K1Y4_TRISP
MHNAESRSVIQWKMCFRLHEWLQFYINDTIMQSEQEKEAVEMAQSICREALQVTQVWIEMDRLEERFHQK